MEKAGKSGYYDIVTLQNAYYRQAVLDSYEKNAIIAQGMQFQRGIPEEFLGNVDNGISIYNGINYKKLPHYIHWGLDKNSLKPVPLKAV